MPSNRALKVRLSSHDGNYGAEKEFGRIAFGERRFRKPVTLVEIISTALVESTINQLANKRSLKSSRCSRVAPRAQTARFTRTGGKSNLLGLCFTWETSRVIHSSSAEAVARAAAEKYRPLGNHLF